MRIIDLKVANHKQARALRETFKDMPATAHNLNLYIDAVLKAEARANGAPPSIEEEDQFIDALKLVDLDVKLILSVGFYKNQKGSVVFTIDRNITPDMSLKVLTDGEFINKVNLAGWEDTSGSMKNTQKLVKLM